MKPITEAANRLDFEDKITGAARYCADIRMEGMLFAKTLRATVARAWIRAIHIPPLPSGMAVIDWRDIPGKNAVPIVTDDQPFLAENCVNYVGEPILLAVGPDRAETASFIRQIVVEYEERKPILTLEEAMGRDGDFISGNQPWFASYGYDKGDLEGAMRRAARCVADTFTTGYQEQAYLEPQGMVASFEDGVITVRGSMQCPYYIVDALKNALGWETDRIRVIQLPTGGGFGGKEEYPSIPAVHAALAAIKTGKPVQLVFDRKEDILCTTKRHPSQITIKSYLDAEGNILARDIDVAADGGAYAGLSSVVLQRMIYSIGGVYRVENLRIHGRVYATNKAVSGAFRGFGGPQAFFAMETHMEHIARQTGMDSVQLRQRHFLRQEDSTSTGGHLRSPVPLHEMTDLALRLSDYYRKREQPNTDSGKLRGIGCSVFFHGCGFTGSGEQDLIRPRVRLRKDVDGIVHVLASSAEIGQGAMTTLSKIVARTLSIPLSQVRYEYPDTKVCPDSGPTVASRSVLVVGKLLLQAGLEMKKRWSEKAFETEARFTYPKGFSWDKENHQGDAYLEYSWGANVVEVELDPVTCDYKIKGVWAVYDAGTPIDKKIVAGQVEGGMAQGLGYGGMENLEYADGKPVQVSFTDYILPTSLDLPPVTFRLVDNESVLGPYGARGLGELTLVGAAPALAAAIENATGRPVNRLPLTPEYLLEVMNGG
ncbi:MAG: xanthine dehydrogenase family protein molybdopterin-binding subunit [Eubacteriales bacterium]|nr:xanthine dehydrogenase family protein molybdopterin-binding subunit [Eubacteriales bacterium]